MRRRRAMRWPPGRHPCRADRWRPSATSSFVRSASPSRCSARRRTATATTGRRRRKCRRRSPMAYTSVTTSAICACTSCASFQATDSYGDDWKEAQEVQAQIADVVTEVYAIESAIARAEKMTTRGDGRASLAADAARVYTDEAASRIAAAVRQVATALTARGVDSAYGPSVQRLAIHCGVDAIMLRRRIADAVIETGKHPF